MEKIFKCVIFDLDGVLVDTAEFHYLAWKSIADELNVPFDRKKNDRLRGVPRMRSLEIVIEDMKEKPADLESLAARKNALYVEMISRITPSDLLPGVKDLLENLKQNNVKIALGSSSKNARPVLKNLQIEHYFDAIVDGYGFVHAKPAPDIFLNGAKLLGMPPEDCVVVEDAQSGIEAARAAGMFAVGMAGAEKLEGADILVRNAGEIPLSLWGIAECNGQKK